MKIARFALVLAACSGTDSGNPPVIDFRRSACHDQSYVAAKDLILQSIDEELVPDARFKGLTCFVAERSADSVQVLVSNYMAGCGSDGGWSPRVEERADGGLDLILQDDDCSTARCGWCLYDLSFTLPAEYATTRALHLFQQGCEGDRMEITAQLALAAPEGAAACSYTSKDALMWRGRGDTGERMLCGTWGDGFETGACDQGLTCSKPTVEGDAPGGRCLRNCTSDAHCDAFSQCRAGVCELRANDVRVVP